MVNDIINGIAEKLGEMFPDAPIYRDEIKQGFTEPCFFILPIMTTQVPEMGNRFRRRHTINVHYFPTQAGGTEEMYGVASALLAGLDYIKAGGDLIRAEKMEHTAHDGVLHFMVDYDLFMFKEKEPAPLMLTLKQKGWVKNG